MTEFTNSKQYDLEGRTLQFAIDVSLFCKRLPKDVINNEHIKQVVRSTGSIGANYIEANEALSKKDFAMRIKICLKESKESRYWLKIIKAVSQEFNQEIDGMINESEELLKIFSTILVKTK